MSERDDPAEVRAARQEVRQAFMDILVLAPANDSDSLGQLTTVMSAVLDQPDEVNLYTQVPHTQRSTSTHRYVRHTESQPLHAGTTQIKVNLNTLVRQSTPSVS